MLRMASGSVPDDGLAWQKEAETAAILKSWDDETNRETTEEETGREAP